MATIRQTEDTAGDTGRLTSRGAVDYSFLDPPYGAPDYPGVSAAAPQIVRKGHTGRFIAREQTPRSGTPGTTPGVQTSVRDLSSPDGGDTLRPVRAGSGLIARAHRRPETSDGRRPIDIG